MANTRKILRVLIACYLLVYATDAFSQIEMSPISAQHDNKKAVKREKVNKYAEFSKKKIDPISKAKVETRKDKIGDIPLRGTTVPLITLEDMTETGGTMNSYDDKINISNVHKIKTTSQEVGLYSIIPSDPYTFGYAEIGTIIGAHGVKGEMKIRFETDFAEVRLKPDTILYVRKPNRRSPRPMQIITGRRHNENTFLVAVKNVKSRLGAAAFTSYSVYVKANEKPPLEKDEYLIRDLVGMTCYVAPSNHKVLSKIFGDVTESSYHYSHIAMYKPEYIVEGVVPPHELCGVHSAVSKLLHSTL